MVRLKFQNQHIGDAMKNRLYRSRQDRVIGGVAGGLAKYFNLDPLLVRILFIAFTIFHGAGILLYIIMWIVVPDEIIVPPVFNTDEPPSGNNETKTEDNDAKTFQTTDQNSTFNQFNYQYPKRRGSLIGGIILITLGMIFLADRIFPFFDFGDIFPILLVFVGVILIVSSVRK